MDVANIIECITLTQLVTNLSLNTQGLLVGSECCSIVPATQVDIANVIDGISLTQLVPNLSLKPQALLEGAEC